MRAGCEGLPDGTGWADGLSAVGDGMNLITVPFLLPFPTLPRSGDGELCFH